MRVFWDIKYISFIVLLSLITFREVLGFESIWPLLLAVSGFWALTQLLTLPFFPESPPYLLMEKQDKDGCMQGMGEEPFMSYLVNY